MKNVSFKQACQGSEASKSSPKICPMVEVWRMRHFCCAGGNQVTNLSCRSIELTEVSRSFKDTVPEMNIMRTPAESTPSTAGRLEDLDRSALPFAEAKAAVGEAPGCLLVQSEAWRSRRHMMPWWNP